MPEQKKILINRSLGEVRAAVINGEDLTDIRLYRDLVPSYVGTVFLGRVTKLSKELQAAYVNLGKNLNGFLPLKTLPKPQGKKPKDLTILLHEGQRIMVQVTTDARSEKQFKLTGRVELVTPTLVFHPNRAGAYVSSRIKDPGRREDLKKFGRILDLNDYGLTFRTDAEHFANEQLSDLTGHMIHHWQSVTKNLKSCECPMVLSQAPEPVEQILRDFAASDVGEILIDDGALVGKAKDWLKTYAQNQVDTLAHYTDKEPLFTRFGVEDEIEQVYAPSVNLKSGGWITIEKTEALTAIDVNMGGATFSSDKAKQVFALNREAAREIFRQIRLRSIGGIIVIDFVDMIDKGDIKSLQNFIDELMMNDPAPMQRGNISSFGLLELTRRAREVSLNELLLEPARSQKTTSTLCLDLLRREAQEATNRPGIPRTAKVNHDMMIWFNQRPELLEDFTKKTGSILKLEHDESSE